MYNNINEECKPEREQTIYTDHEDIIVELHNVIDILEKRLNRVLLADNSNDKLGNSIPLAAQVASSKSQLKAWVSEQSSTIKTAISRINDLLNRLDLD